MKPQPQATEEIQQEQKVKTALNEWQDELVNKAEGTKNCYQNFFNEFSEYMKMTADELLKQRQQDALNPNMKIQRRIETKFLIFINKKKQEGYSISTQQIIFASIRLFFECHYFPLKMRRSDYPEGDSNGAKRATKETTLKLLDNIAQSDQNSPMYKAVIHSLNDSGLRIGDLRSLNCDFFLNALKTNTDTKLIMLNIITQKTKLTAKAFFGEEAIEAIKQYLDFRREGSSKVEPETITPNSPLFKTWKHGKVKRISRSTLSAMILRHFQQIGESKMSAHSFRKKLQTDLEKGGMNTNWIDQVLGHELMNSRDAYSLPTDEELREAYAKAYQFIRVYPEIGKQVIEQSNDEQKRITPIQTNMQANVGENYPVAEARNMIEVKALLAKGYRYEMDFEGIKLFVKK